MTPIKLSPSVAATPRGYAELQKAPETVTYDGFYVGRQRQDPAIVTITPPAQIFHPVFQEFLDRIDDTTLPLDEGVVSVTSALMSTTMETHSE